MGVMPMTVGRSISAYGVGSASVERTARPRRSFNPGTVPAAKVQAAFGVGAAVIGLAGVLLPHPSGFNEAGLVAIQASSLIMGIGLFAFAGHIPGIVLRVLPFLAIAMTTLAIWFTDDATSAYAFFYLWPNLYAFYFLSRAEVAVTIGFSVATYAAAIVILGTPGGVADDSEIHYLVMLTGTLVVAGALLLYLRGRVERLMGRLSDASRTDLLTDLPNSKALHETLTTELERARLGGSKVSVLVADLDRFKAVNEALGHKTGDELLRRIGQLYTEATRRIDVVARTGPTEFTIVLPESEQTDAYLLAEQLLARVRRGFRDEFMPLTTSVGIATYPTHAATVEELVKLAEQAVDAAKLLGRDRAVVSSPEVQEVLSGTLRRPLDAPAHLATMVSLAEALDLRDSGTATHSKRVGHLSQMIAREIGLSEYRAERVRLAGILHDIGKVGVPDSILCKAGPLDEIEWDEMRKHPEIGARILGTRELVDIRHWVLASHERPDGRGYPRGLTGDEIPIEAKILSVADAYEAMISDRVYRPAIGPDAAREELRVNSGTQFDAEAVEALFRALDREQQAVEAS